MKLLTGALLISIGMVFGQWIGVRDYKATCELVGNGNGLQWLECDK